MSENAIALETRLGRPEDYESALDIQKRAYLAKEAPLYGSDIPPLSETPETLAAELAGGKQLLVGLWNGKIVASLRMQILEDGTAYFCRLSVDPDVQGKGIGKKMIAAFEQRYPLAPQYALDCGVRSEENLYIYSRLGYKKTEKTLQVPNGPECVVMIKKRT